MIQVLPPSIILREHASPRAQGALDIIRAVTPLGDEGQTDEIELDFDSLDAPTLWRLEAYLRSLNAGNGNFHVEVCPVLPPVLGEPG